MYRDPPKQVGSGGLRYGIPQIKEPYQAGFPFVKPSSLLYLLPPTPQLLFLNDNPPPPP